VKRAVLLFACLCVSVAGCAEYDRCPLEYNLVNPCDEDGLVEGCAHLLMVFRNQIFPPDPGPGPVGDPTTELWCTREPGECGFRCEGKPVSGVVEDLLCYESQDGEPIARAVMDLLVGYNGGNPANLLFGGIDEFIRTTVTDPAGPVGSCSDMNQDGSRFGHTATLLLSGDVLISCSADSSTYPAESPPSTRKHRPSAAACSSCLYRPISSMNTSEDGARRDDLHNPLQPRVPGLHHRRLLPARSLILRSQF
jgi:hypothetical protein